MAYEHTVHMSHFGTVLDTPNTLVSILNLTTDLLPRVTDIVARGRHGEIPGWGVYRGFKRKLLHRVPQMSFLWCIQFLSGVCSGVRDQDVTQAGLPH